MRSRGALALLILGLGYTYLGHHLAAPFGAAAWALFTLPFLSVLWMPLSYWRREQPGDTVATRAGVWAAYLSFGLLSFFLFYCVLWDLALVSVQGAALIAARPLDLPLWLADERASLFVTGLALASVGAGVVQVRMPPRVDRVRVPIANLPAGLEGYRIAQLSDLHIGPTIRRAWVERIVAIVNSLEADAIALTGDLVDGIVSETSSQTEPLSSLRARDGAFYVTGNHEYYWDADAWIEQFRAQGMRPLVNEHVVITRKEGAGASAQLAIAGIADLWSGDSDPARAIAGAPEDAIKILLSHQPNVALQAAGLGYHLQLSGHTHGGQFVPWIWVIGFLQHFTRGLKKHRDLWVYVNRGTGYWGPPVRLGSPAEITLLELVRA